MLDESTADAPEAKAEVFISRNNQTHGPYPRDVVANWINTGKVNRFDLACTDQTPWQPVEKLLWPERFAVPKTQPIPATSTGLTGKQLALIIAAPVLIVGLLVVLVILDESQKTSVSRSANSASSQRATTGNPAHDILVALSSGDQATSLGKSVGERRRELCLLHGNGA